MIKMREIKKYADRLAEKFRPKRIILFGSYAGGKPTENSDVDLLVIMPFKGRAVKQAIKIELEEPAVFPTDIITRTPGEVNKRLKMGDPFISEIVNFGIPLYESYSR